VVPENRYYRDGERPARVRHDSRLFRFAVRRQVTREEKEIRLALERGEGLRHFIAPVLVAVDVARGGDADPSVLSFHHSGDEGTGDA
jgi:hypothetical protein